MDWMRLFREGFVAGLIGAGCVALWFLVVDAISGQPFYTPAMLGSAVFWGLRDPARVAVAFPPVIGYTLLHVVAFVVVGVIAASLAALVDRSPPTLFLAVVFFAVFEVGFYIVVALLGDDEVTVKRFYREANGFRLQPENARMLPIRVAAVHICGKVTGLVRPSVY